MSKQAAPPLTAAAAGLQSEEDDWDAIDVDALKIPSLQAPEPAPAPAPAPVPAAAAGGALFSQQLALLNLYSSSSLHSSLYSL
jgi:hypothetical protein